MRKAKYSLTILLFLFSMQQSDAQSSGYCAFADSGCTWKEYDSYYIGMNLHEFYFNEFIYGDTLINGTLYQKVFKTGSADVKNMTNGEIVSSSNYSNCFVASIRQDIKARRVYIYTSSSESGGEQVLYDFNLSLGDTLPLSYIHREANDTIWIAGIDSVPGDNGYRKEYILQDNIGYVNDNPVLIEGIGSSFGLLYTIDHPFENTGHLYCFKVNGVAQYADGTPDACDLPTGINDKKMSGGVLLYPNPGGDQFTILSEYPHPDEAVTVTVMNVFGEVVIRETMNWNSDMRIATEAISPGIYLVQMVSQSVNLVRRFTKE